VPGERDLASLLAEPPASTEIVAYCRGRYCVMSLEAVRLLRTHGYRSARWTAACPNGATRACQSLPHDGRPAWTRWPSTNRQVIRL
jgi:rhodanese-related sulfurtransferase